MKKFILVVLIFSAVLPIAAQQRKTKGTRSSTLAQARVATSVPETLKIVPAGENAPEAIIRVVSMTTIAPGKHRVNVAGGPCLSQPRTRLVYIVDTKETLAKGDLFFVVPVSSGWALRRATSREAAQYANCRWRDDEPEESTPDHRTSRTVSKPQARKTSNISATPAVISRFIKAIQGRDFKTVIDLTYSYQIEVSGIKSQNPRVLWEKKVGEFYERKISDITGEASFWGDYFRGVGAMTGDPAQNFRAVAYLLPQSCKWQISETRNETITSVIEGQFNQTTVYVTVNYPLDQSTPIVDKRFLKQTMLKFGVRSGTQSVANVYQVGEVNTFWAKPYPKEAMAFLVSKYKDDILKGDKDAINEVSEIAGWEVVEPYLLEVAEQQPPYTKPFNLAIDTLADHRVQKAVPIIVKALRGRNPIEILVEGEGWWSRPDINLVTALQKIGKSEFNEATLILKERLSKIIGKDRDWINIHLAALASVDDDAWSSFPNKNFEEIVKEVSRKQRNASVIDSSSSNNEITMAFFGSLRPCNRGVGYRCPSDLRYGSVKIIDARTVEVYGQIDEDRGGFDFRKVGNFTMVLKRKDHQLDKWLVQEITRQN
jgi:hypothetical protein